MTHENNIITKRYIPTEVRALTGSDTKSRTISGYAAVFNQETEIFPDCFEVIAPGAFAQALSRYDTACLFNHDEDCLLGRKSSGTLTLSEDDKGLPFSCNLPNSREDIFELIQRKDITGCSFSFTIKKDMYEERADGTVLRTILEVNKIYDVGPVVYPAYDGTSVITDSEKKSFEAFREERKKLKSSKAIDPVDIDYSIYDQSITLHKHTF